MGQWYVMNICYIRETYTIQFKMKLKRLFVLLSVWTVLMSVTSCGSYKRLALIQDMKVDTTYIVQDRHDSRISVGDKLAITVTCSNPELATPFNIVSGHSYYNRAEDENEEGVIMRAEGDKGYVVDRNGDIDFPVLGRINVAGTTLVELKQEIETRLKSKSYIQDPLVFVEFMNFQVTMLGEVANGNYVFPSGNVTILEALAKVGGPKTSAVIDEVWVVRTNGGARKLYTVNLKSTSLYDSPVYYLQQNDLVYFKPKDNIIDNEINNRLTAFTSVMSVLSFLTSIVTILLLYTRK